MNYIAHLTGFFRRVARDHRLNPTHVSLYMALFQQWNLNRFRNPISIARSEVMGISRIASRVTYHKCIRELHAWGYLHYEPSYNHFRGSLVYMLPFEKQQQVERITQATGCTGGEPEPDSGWTGTEPEVSPFINAINPINSLKVGGYAREEMKEMEREAARCNRKEKDCAEKEKAGATVPPAQEAVQSFFLAEGETTREAELFFLHYSANGWLVGKVPMRDWQAAACKWMLNRFNDKTYAGHRTGSASTDSGARNYDEPL